ncbi:MAG TPA: hypothetical protein VI981_01475, partial [Candidatus Paceibacterota bacterium]
MQSIAWITIFCFTANSLFAQVPHLQFEGVTSRAASELPLPPYLGLNPLNISTEHGKVAEF